ncbi:MAG: gliding motility-associated C-terminal domain-containing protein [Chloroflexi bacterium]|nr:gliding motility-associated C-terminal domain-containing protein [Chloroflexota bacterium]
MKPLPRRIVPSGTLAVLLVVLGLLGACAPSRPLLTQASLSRATLTPSTTDRLDLTYSLSRPATVSIVVDLPGGRSIRLRADEPRPAAGAYVYAFDGTVPDDADPAARHVLGDGDYRLRVEARDLAGVTQSAGFDLTIEGADTVPPAIDDLAVYPPTLTPNFDGIDDVASITYHLTERARVFAFATSAAGQRVYIGTQELLEPGEYRETWDGTYKERPLPDGVYQFTIRATDLAGNAVTETAPITLTSSGRPDARILQISFSPRRLMLGDILHVEAVVRNTGTVPLRTQGPDPGYLYSSFESFSAIAGQQFIDRVGVWRLGADWAGSPTATGSKYPYRWGLGRDLAPGEEATVTGSIRIDHGPNLDRMVGPPTNRFFFYAGLIHEGINFQDDRVGGTWIEVGY